MSEVKRLEMDHKGLPFVDDNGVYVLYEDYAELKAQRDALAAENAAMKSAIKYVCSTDNFPDYHPDGMGCGIEDRGIVDRYEAARYGWDEAVERFYSEVMPCAADIETPATDAYLNSVRADAVDEFGKYHNFSEKLFIQQEAKKYAEKLRAGEPS